MGQELDAEQEKPRQLTLEEIEAAQLDHEQKQQSLRDEEAATLARQNELKAQAGQDYATRADLVYESRQILQGIEDAHAAQIEERLAEVDRLGKSQTEKEAELAQGEEEFNALSDRFNRISAMIVRIKGKGPESDIAETTSQALKEAQSNYDALSAKRSLVIDQLEKIKTGRQITDAAVAHYHLLIERQQQIAEQLTALEENPVLVELLADEAKNEGQLRVQFKREALTAAETYSKMNPERQALVEKLVDQYLTEEFEARGINGIKDPHQKMERKRDLVQHMAYSFTIDDTQRLAYGYNIDNFDVIKDQIFAGKFLHNLIGGFGSENGTAGFAEWAVNGINTGREEPRNSPRHQHAIAEGVYRHLGTINLLRANSLGLDKGPLRGRITVGFESWQNIENELRQTGELTVDLGEKPIIPVNASPGQKARIERGYEENFQAARELSQTIAQKQEKDRLERITAVETEVKRLQGLLERAKEIENHIRQLGDVSQFGARLSNARASLHDKEIDLKTNQADLDHTGSLSFLRRGKLEQEIGRLESAKSVNQREVERFEKILEDIEKLKAEKAEIGDTYKIEQTIRKFEDELTRTRR